MAKSDKRASRCKNSSSPAEDFGGTGDVSEATESDTAVSVAAVAGGAL
jgi:hypothetical protein